METTPLSKAELQGGYHFFSYQYLQRGEIISTCYFIVIHPGHTDKYFSQESNSSAISIINYLCEFKSYWEN